LVIVQLTSAWQIPNSPWSSSRDQAARFSFLLGSPAFFGAGLLQIVKVMRTDAAVLTDGLAPIAVGFVASAVSGVLAIHFLLRYLRTRTLYIFSVYCLGLGLLTIVLSYLQ
jgi:undecaprenyl-diphosphatase